MSLFLKKQKKAEKENRVCDLSGTIFEGDIDFKNRKISTTILFRNTEFNGIADFRNVEFNGIVNLVLLNLIKKFTL